MIISSIHKKQTNKQTLGFTGELSHIFFLKIITSIHTEIIDLTFNLSDATGSPFLGDVLALPYPSVLEIVAEFIPEHKDLTWSHFFLPGLGLNTKVVHRVLETVGGGKHAALSYHT